MKNNNIIYIIIVIILVSILCNPLNAQDSIVIKKSEYSKRDNYIIKEDTYNFPVVDLHLGFGIINGMRIGLRVQFENNISVEAAYGYTNILLFAFGSADGEHIYSAGINYHFSKTELPFISLIGVVKKHDGNSSIKSVSISPNIGFISLPESRWRFFVRGGAAYEIQKNDSQFYFNADLGFGYRF